MHNINNLIVFFLIFINIFLIVFIVTNKFLLSTKLNLLDIPKKNKIHKVATPLLGGVLTLITLIFFYLCQFFINNLVINIEIFFSSILFFLIGIQDDRKNLSYKIKFILFFLVFYFFIFIEKNFVLNQIYFETFNKTFELNNITSIMLTLLCLLLLVNATNLSDGINGLCFGTFIFWFIYLITLNFSKFNIVLLILYLFITIYIFILIFNGKIFLGNSGSHFIGSFIGLSFIEHYNSILNNQEIIKKLSVEEIFLVLMLPGIDLFLLFALRILKKKKSFQI